MYHHQLHGGRQRYAPSAAARIAAIVGTIAVLTAGCTAATNSTDDSTSAVTTTVSAVTLAPRDAAQPPPPPTPRVAANCPYLSTREVADLNGQLVAETRLDTAYDPPACFFLIGDRSVQLSVWVLQASSAAQASTIVDRAAPIVISDPASEPPGWTGGRSGGPGGAVYAVAKGAVSVVVTSNQAQSVKAQRVAERVIAVLALS